MNPSGPSKHPTSSLARWDIQPTSSKSSKRSLPMYSARPSVHSLTFWSSRISARRHREPTDRPTDGVSQAVALRFQRGDVPMCMYSAGPTLTVATRIALEREDGRMIVSPTSTDAGARASSASRLVKLRKLGCVIMRSRFFGPSRACAAVKTANRAMPRRKGQQSAAERGRASLRQPTLGGRDGVVALAVVVVVGVLGHHARRGQRGPLVQVGRLHGELHREPLRHHLPSRDDQGRASTHVSVRSGRAQEGLWRQMADLDDTAEQHLSLDGQRAFAARAVAVDRHVALVQGAGHPRVEARYHHRVEHAVDLPARADRPTRHAR